MVLLGSAAVDGVNATSLRRPAFDPLSQKHLPLSGVIIFGHLS